MKKAVQLDTLAPKKRIQLFKEIEEKKQEEIEELKKRQKEQEQELERARTRLEESIDALEDEKDYLSEQAEEELKEEKQVQEALSIDELAEQIPTQNIGDHISYDGLDALKADTLYELTNYNTYNELKKLEEKVYLSREEQEQLHVFQNKVNLLQDAYSQQDITNLDQERGNYISRTEKVLKKIHDRMHNLNASSDYSQGEFRW